MVMKRRAGVLHKSDSEVSGEKQLGKSLKLKITQKNNLESGKVCFSLYVIYVSVLHNSVLT